MSTESMTLVINGQAHELGPATGPVTVERLLREILPETGPAPRGACAVEVNRRLIPRGEHATATLADGDTIEIVTLVGGG